MAEKISNWVKKLDQLLESMFEKKTNIFVCVGSFLSILIVRCFIEQFVALSSPLTPEEILVEIVHNLFFFALSFLLLWIFSSFFLKMNPAKLAWLFNWSFFLMLFPPLIDMARTKGEIYWSFYLLGSAGTLWKEFISIFGNLPAGIVYFGTKITFISAIIFLSILVFVRTKSLWRGIFSLFGSYTLLFLMGAYPSVLTYVSYFILKKPLSEVNEISIVQFVSSSFDVFAVEFSSLMYIFSYHLNFFYFPFLLLLLGVLFFRISPQKSIAVVKNARYPQLIYHGGLFFVGMGLGILRYPENFQLNLVSFFAVITLVASIFLAWEASVIVNDVYDLEIDKITNSNRPLPSGTFEKKEYQELGFLFFFLSLLGAVVVGFWFFVLLLVYQILAWMYSAKPYRLKKFPLVATFVSALASLAVLCMGYILLSDNQSIHSLSWRIIALLLVSYTISLPIKDFKDIEGDKKDEIWTIPVLLDEKKGRLIVATGMFISFIASVFFLNELRLFFWALIFGAITFLVVTSKKTKPTGLFWWVLGIVSIYLLIMIKIILVDNLGRFNF